MKVPVEDGCGAGASNIAEGSNTLDKLHLGLQGSRLLQDGKDRQSFTLSNRSEVEISSFAQYG